MQPHVFAFFPETAPTQAKYPTSQAKRQAAQDWLSLLDHQDALTADWTNSESCSVTPSPTYQDAEELKTIVRDKVRIALADILSERVVKLLSNKQLTNAMFVRKKKEVKVLVVSPDDVYKERKVVQEVIESWNIRNSNDRQIKLEAVFLEKHAASGNRGNGDGSQEAITSQIVGECDCAIGIFWTRIGNDTGVATSGALEEIERTQRMGKPVMLYFSDVPVSPKKIDFQQRQMLDEYRTSLSPLAPADEYETLDEFRKKLSDHLSLQIPKWFPLDEGDGSNTLPQKFIPKVFITYSWDDDNHKSWVAELATRLRGNGVETRIDQWHAVPGDQLPEFMEREIRNNDYVLIICTPKYRSKCDKREGGAGYEGDIITAEVYTTKNHRKFIPVLAHGTWDEASPSWLKGKYYVDLSSLERYEQGYSCLLATLINASPSLPPVNPRMLDVLPSESLPPSPIIVRAEKSRNSFYNKYEDNAEYILIPGGSYLYSVTGREERVYDLYMAKYTVTNRLFRKFIAFLQAKGLERSLQESAISLRDELKVLAKKGLWWKKFADDLHAAGNDLAYFFCSKYNNEEKLNGEHQPVVGVSWYAARAYCLWLSMLEGGRTLYSLPSEIEWEWAAGGCRSGAVQNVRRWPWPEDEGELSFRLANYGNKIGATTVVGSYPDGRTPEGLHDMLGNIWEWMDNWFDEKKQFHAIRGGSWYSDADALHCSSQYGYDPWLSRSYRVGFRVVRSSPFP